MSLALNIVSFDVPFPPNYGGVIDVYYKLYWLKQAGVKIHLHCFAYGRHPAAQLEALCESVRYYPRKTGFFSNLSLLPYTVKSRQSEELARNLLKNDHPILFEVLHTCYLVDDGRFKNRRKIYRHSNIEHEYYNELAKTERNLLKKYFLRIEAIKLKRFEKVLRAADVILAVNQKDTEYFRQKFPNVKSVYLPSFHPAEDVSVSLGKGNYILFHGNLSISENYESASWLIEHVFSKITHRVIIAGLNPPDFLVAACKPYPHIELVENPDADRMNLLINGAQVHVLHTAQPTGLKLKLLNVLFAGRFIVLNKFMLSGTGLAGGQSLQIADSPDEYCEKINACFERSFSEADISERRRLTQGFQNKGNVQKLIAEIF